MLLKVAKTLAMVALAVILLHCLPGVCEEAFALPGTSGVTSSDGCVSGDSCCASNSFLRTASDVSLGALDVEQSAPAIHASATQLTVSVVADSQEIYSPPPDLTKLGKLTI